MSDKLPPFSALRALEAASRHGSYTCAARELAVTHSAVSQSIRRLEEEVGAKLFERRGGVMRPLPAALQLAHAYSEASESLTRSLREITERRVQEPLLLCAPADLGRLWMAPRLERFEAAFPNVSVELRTKSDAAGLRDDPDSAFFGFEPADAAGLHVVPLIEARVFPVCSPEFAQRHGLNVPAALIGVPLLAERSLSWTEWLARAGVSTGPGARRREVEDAAMALEAAAGGLGVALTHSLAAESYLLAGRLVAPFGPTTSRRFGLARRAHGGGRAFLSEVAGWLKMEARQTLDRLGGLAPR